MSCKTLFAAALCASLLSTAGLAADIAVNDPYIRSSGASAVTGAAFMEIENTGPDDDRLVGVRSDIAERVELHTHLEDADGVMRMMEKEGGISVPAGGSALLRRGGDHVMFLGLTRPLAQGDTVETVFVFERAGEIAVTLPVDLERKPMHGGHSQGMKTQGMKTGD